MIPSPELTKRQFNEIIRSEVNDKPRWEINKAMEEDLLRVDSEPFLTLMLNRLWRN